MSGEIESDTDHNRTRRDGYEDEVEAGGSAVLTEAQAKERLHVFRW